MKLIYNNKDITNSIKIISAILIDNAGGKADSMDILLADTNYLWRNYPPCEGDKICVSINSFDSGIMYLDQFKIMRGKILLRAISTPLIAKENKYRSWEKTNFKTIACDLATDLNLNIEFYNIKNNFYDRLDQINETNLQFLNKLCVFEGYRLKITNEKIIIFNESHFENFKSIQSYSIDDFIGEYYFENKNSNIFSSCTINTVDFNYKYIPNKLFNGPNLRIDNINIANEGEAERFAKNILKNFNKFKQTGKFNLELTPIFSSNTVDLYNVGLDGKYFIESVKHNLTQNLTTVYARRLEV